MKIKTVIGLLLTMPLVSIAGRYDAAISYGRVVDVEPIYQSVSVPDRREICEVTRNNDGYRQQDKHNTAGAVLGGIIGGAIGNRFGRGHGRDASTALGVIVGASVGAHSKQPNNYRRCHTETYYYQDTQLVGYDVTYDYKGTLYQTQMNRHPGDRVKLSVNVDVIE